MLTYIFPVAVAVVCMAVLLAYAYRQVLAERRILEEDANKECAHVWRSIVAPYMRQCKRCRLVTYHEDPGGVFPDGLREWAEWYLKLPLDEPLPASGGVTYYHDGTPRCRCLKCAQQRKNTQPTTPKQ